MCWMQASLLQVMQALILQLTAGMEACYQNTHGLLLAQQKSKQTPLKL